MAGLGWLFGELKSYGFTDTQGKEIPELIEILNGLRKENGEEPVSEGAAGYRQNANYDKISGKNREKMTPADKIASIDIKSGEDNILPELNEKNLIEIGAKKNKPVLIKKYIFERNASLHPEVEKEDENKLIGEALYNPAKIFKGNKEGYFIFAQVVRVSSKKGEPRYGTVLLDVSETLNNFEVIHWHIMIPKELARAEKKNK